MNDTDSLKSKLTQALKHSVLTANDQRVEEFITLLEAFIDSKQTVYAAPSYEEVLYGHADEAYEPEYSEADEEYEQYMEARYGRWTD